jgi:hypothetical protein
MCRSSSRNSFLEEFPGGFLAVEVRLREPDMPALTMRFKVSPALQDATDIGINSPVRPILKDPTLLPVRKVQDTFADMITIGRTANNDLVLADISISKFHAYVTVTEDGIRVSDAGSRSGTEVDGIKLAPRGAPAVLDNGSRIRFGYVDCQYVTASALWDSLHG